MKNESLCLAIAFASVVAVAPFSYGANLVDINVVGDVSGHLACVKGRPFLLTSKGDGADDTWEMSTGGSNSKGIRVNVKDGSRLLSFDLSEDKNDVSLAEVAGDNTKWYVTRIGPGDGEGPFVIRAARSAIQGWYLDFDEKHEAKIDTGDGKTIVGYPLILRNKTSRVVKFNIGEYSR